MPLCFGSYIETKGYSKNNPITTDMKCQFSWNPHEGFLHQKFGLGYTFLGKYYIFLDIWRTISPKT